mmetsp:Transcript_16133/g.25558  ORF Transcript_16133/g.25558 Transcript_16133/m.25558 type:complete len:212 (-) Transcript_16133:240-875(-)
MRVPLSVPRPNKPRPASPRLLTWPGVKTPNGRAFLYLGFLAMQTACRVVAQAMGGYTFTEEHGEFEGGSRWLESRGRERGSSRRPSRFADHSQGARGREETWFTSRGARRRARETSCVCFRCRISRLTSYAIWGWSVGRAIGLCFYRLHRELRLRGRTWGWRRSRCWRMLRGSPRGWVGWGRRIIMQRKRSCRRLTSSDDGLIVVTDKGIF